MPRELPRKAGRPAKITTETIEVKTEGTLTKQVKVERRERRSNGETSNKFRFNRPEYEREGYNRYWPADTGNRLNELYNQDYDFVLDENGEKIKQFGGTDRFGNRFDHYLMEKPKDWFEDDKRAKLEKNNLEQEKKNNQVIAGASRGLQMYRSKSDENAALTEID